MATQFAPPPPAAITRVLSTFDRAQLAGFVAVAIDLLDLAEPDHDLEEDDLPEDDDPAEEAESSTDVAWREQISQVATQFRHKDGIDLHHTAIGTPEDAEDDDNDSGQDDYGEMVNEDGSDSVLETPPIYGIDQSLGPTNQAEAARDDMAGELGLIRTPTGWKKRPL